MYLERLVNFCDKCVQRLCRVLRPVCGKKMIIEDIHQHRRHTSMRCKAAHAAPHHRMAVCEGINLPMTGHARLEYWIKHAEFGRIQEIRQQVAETKYSRIFREQGMREPVHESVCLWFELHNIS